jgi:hypothetical protein
MLSNNVFYGESFSLRNSTKRNYFISLLLNQPLLTYRCSATTYFMANRFVYAIVQSVTILYRCF